MEKFTTLSGVAAALKMVNVDTDMIIPKQHLKTIKRTGLGVHLFDELRYTADGEEIADFVLNQGPWRQARILVVGANFGCGSSREHAAWALLDFGIRCLIAPSFADIFYNNCFKNGVLPISLAPADVDSVMADAEAGAVLGIDLEAQTVTRPQGQVPQGQVIAFEIDPFRKKCLLGGLDDIALSLQRADRIEAFEERQRAAQPWLYG